MKRTLLPLHIGNLILCLTSICIAGFGIFMVIVGFYSLLVHTRYESGVLILAGSYATYLFLFVLVYNLHNKIILTNNKI